MSEFELTAESNPLLENDEDAEVYAAQQVRRVKNAKAAKRRSFALIILFGLGAVVSLFLTIPLFRHHTPKARPEDPAKDFPVTHLEPEFFQEYGSQRVQIKYGPFTVPGSTVDNGMRNFGLDDAQLPCHGCLITWMQADLEFADGSSANAATGMWLHHTVFMNLGRPAVKSCGSGRERFFASGNERTVMDCTHEGSEKSGYWLEQTDQVAVQTELMNRSPHPRDAFLVITYEYLPAPPSTFSNVTSIWLDVGDCNSDIPVPEGAAQFELDMAPWTATRSGRVLSIFSHLHDGGVRLDVRRDDEVICRSIATYGDTSEELRDMAMSHISEMSTCRDPGRMREGERWTLKAQYDLNAHEPMLNERGEPEDVMGIAVVYLILD